MGENEWLIIATENNYRLSWFLKGYDEKNMWIWMSKYNPLT